MRSPARLFAEIATRIARGRASVATLTLVTVATLVAPAGASAALIVWHRDAFVHDNVYPLAADDTGVYTSGGNDLRKYSHAGDLQWDRSLTVSGGPLLMQSVAADATGVYVAGSLAGTLPGQTAGHEPLSPFVAKYSSDGVLAWAVQFEVPTRYPEGALGIEDAVTLGPDGVYVGGTYYPDGFLARFNRDGSTGWEYPSGLIGEFYGAIAADDMGVAIGMGTDSSGAPLAAAFSPAGGHRWAATSGGSRWPSEAQRAAGIPLSRRFTCRSALAGLWVFVGGILMIAMGVLGVLGTSVAHLASGALLRMNAMHRGGARPFRVLAIAI